MSVGLALAVYVLTNMGLTVLLVWPVDGPGAWVRERLLRRVLPGSAGKALDCYICLSVWVGLAAAPFWLMAGYRVCGVGWLILPAAFWLAMPEARSGK